MVTRTSKIISRLNQALRPGPAGQFANAAGNAFGAAVNGCAMSWKDHGNTRRAGEKFQAGSALRTIDAAFAGARKKQRAAPLKRLVRIPNFAGRLRITSQEASDPFRAK